MKVQSINSFSYYQVHVQTKKTNGMSASCPSPEKFFAVPYSGMAYFTGVTHGGDKLKKLVRYGITDMYTGQPLLDVKTLEYLQYKNIFDKSLKDLIVFLKPHEDTLIASGKEFYDIVKETAITRPNITLSDVIKSNRHAHEENLVSKQREIFNKLIYKGLNLPGELFKDLAILTNINMQRLVNDDVVLPFSETEFNYKLKRIAETIKNRHNKEEISAMKEMQRMSAKLFKSSSDAKQQHSSHITLKQRKKTPGIVKATLRKKLEHQMKPEVLKKNSENLDKIRQYFETSILKDNPELINLFKGADAKIHGYPYYAKFERKSFLYELKKITKQLKDRDFAHELMNKAIELPTSYESLSAFIVKYSNDANDKIGYYMMKDSLVSVDHLVPKKGGGHNTLRNFGLSSVGVNREKSNTPFAEFVKKHPETYVNCQKYVDRLIELCNAGIFDKLDIPRSYIKDFAATIYKISPPEKRLVLDISKFKD